MLKEQLISFETAKLAKEKGFNFVFDGKYNYDLGFHSFVTKRNNKNIIIPLPHWFLDTDQNAQQYEDLNIDAPSQSLLQKWLREYHNIHIEVNKEKESLFFVFNNTFLKEYIGNGNTYEDVLEIGLQEGLKLI